MTKLVSKIKYQYHDLILNARLFSWMDVLKYYYYSYFLRKEFITVKLKAKELNKVKLQIRCRNGVDRNVLNYVFNQKYHITNEPFLNKQNPVILDLGSNIGCTVLDFKLRYPGSIIYGFEMDLDNYNLAMTNCKGFSNVYLFNQAVWIKKDTIVYDKSNQPDAYSIINVQNSKKSLSVASLSISDIINENNIGSIDFLKMDIEGAEIDILNEDDLSWLTLVHSFNIEFHHISDSMLEKYIPLLSAYGFNVSKSKYHWSALIGTRI